MTSDGWAGETYEEQFPQMRTIQRLWEEHRLDESATLISTLPLSAESLLLHVQQRLLEADASGVGPDLEELQPLLRSAVDADPTNPRILLPAASMSFDARDYRAAQQYLVDLYRQTPLLDEDEQAMVAYLAGMISWWTGQVRQAEKPLRLAVKLAPSEPAYRHALDRLIVGRPFLAPGNWR
jgi:predicted Zn-dependent protease